MRALVLGHFSTVGDIEVMQEVERHLSSARMDWDIAPLSKALLRLNPNWLDIHTVTPSDYTHLIIVCGPFWRPSYVRYGVDLDAFAHCTRIGVNLSMIEDVDTYNPFDRLIGRDNNREAKPDISFLHEVARTPVVGLCLAGFQKEYGDRQRRDEAGELLRSLARRNRVAVVELDTEWPIERNNCGLGSPREFEAVCSRLDVMLTTRLHGTVLSLKNGVPVVAVDAIAGGAKVLRQARAIGWPEVFSIDQATNAVLDGALARCLTPVGRDHAQLCAIRAREALSNFSHEFGEALDAKPLGKPSFTGPSQSKSPVARRVAKTTNNFYRFLKGRFSR